MHWIAILFIVVVTIGILTILLVICSYCCCYPLCNETRSSSSSSREVRHNEYYSNSAQALPSSMPLNSAFAKNGNDSAPLLVPYLPQAQAIGFTYPLDETHSEISETRHSSVSTPASGVVVSRTTNITPYPSESEVTRAPYPTAVSSHAPGYTTSYLYSDSERTRRQEPQINGSSNSYTSTSVTPYSSVTTTPYPIESHTTYTTETQSSNKAKPYPVATSLYPAQSHTSYTTETQSSNKTKPYSKKNTTSYSTTTKTSYVAENLPPSYLDSVHKYPTMQNNLQRGSSQTSLYDNEM